MDILVGDRVILRNKRVGVVTTYENNLFGIRQLGSDRYYSYNEEFNGKYISPKSISDFDIMRIERSCSFNTIFKRKELIDNKEREYLSKVIEPFRDRVRRFRIVESLSEKRGYLKIVLDDSDSLCFPNFDKGTMYKGMKFDEDYTLEELGL